MKLFCLLFGHKTGQYTSQGLEILPVGKVWETSSKIYQHKDMRHQAGVEVNRFFCSRCKEECVEVMS